MESTFKNEKWNWLFFRNQLIFINIMGKSHESSDLVSFVLYCKEAKIFWINIFFILYASSCKGKIILRNHESARLRGCEAARLRGIFFSLQQWLMVVKRLISWDFPMNMAFWTPLLGANWKFHETFLFATVSHGCNVENILCN